MDKIELNKEATEIIEKTFVENNFQVIPSDLPVGQVNFSVISSNNTKLKIKVKALTQIGSYVNIRKTNFNINDPNLYMALLYLPSNKIDRCLYLIPAIDWGKDIYPLSGKDYIGKKSEPEWGITYSQKAKDALEPYRFSNMIHKI